MKVLLYITGAANGAFDQLKKIIGKVVPEGDFRICRRPRDLSVSLRQVWKGYEIAVLVAMNTQELEEIVSLQDLLEDLRIILILPDRESRTISRGHVLRPRFLTFVDENFANLAAVLTKMVGNTGLST